MTNKIQEQVRLLLEVIADLAEQREEINWLRCQLDNDDMNSRYDAALKHIEALTEDRNFWRAESKRLAVTLNNFGAVYELNKN